MKKAFKDLTIVALAMVGVCGGLANYGLPFSSPVAFGQANPQGIEQIAGTIERITQPNRPWAGVHLILKIRTETLDVALGPSDYVDSQGVVLAAGDRVSVRGVRTQIDGQPTLIAYEVQKGNQVLKLRDAAGNPLWAGRGRRR